MLDFFNWILSSIGSALTSVLPTSPFHDIIVNFSNVASEYLGWLNWFIPIKEFLAIGGIWLGCISAFYIYSVIMRWVKMIGD